MEGALSPTQVQQVIALITENTGAQMGDLNTRAQGLRTELGEVKREVAEKDKALQRAQAGLPSFGMFSHKPSLESQVSQGTPRATAVAQESVAYPQTKVKNSGGKKTAADEDEEYGSEYAADFDEENESLA